MATVDVLIASPLPVALGERVAAADPRLRVHHDPTLLPPARWPADHAGDPAWRRDPAREGEWQALLARAEALYGVPDESPDGFRAILAACPRLRFIQATSAGAGQQVRAAGLVGELDRVAIATAAGVHAAPLAEFALFGLLAFSRDVLGLERDRASRTWPSHRTPHRELRGQSVLVLGLGGIGREVARLADGFGMHVLGVRHGAGEPVPHVAEQHPTSALGDLLPRVDAVVVTLPLTDETECLLDAGMLERLKPGAVVVNVGRGAVIDEAALVDALRGGRVGGAALDVFATEPLPPDSPLWTLPNVLISPHSAAVSPYEDDRIADLFVENLRRLLADEPILNRLTPARPY